MVVAFRLHAGPPVMTGIIIGVVIQTDDSHANRGSGDAGKMAGGESVHGADYTTGRLDAQAVNELKLRQRYSHVSRPSFRRKPTAVLEELQLNVRRGDGPAVLNVQDTPTLSTMSDKAPAGIARGLKSVFSQSSRRRRFSRHLSLALADIPLLRQHPVRSRPMGRSLGKAPAAIEVRIDS
jgi:hypothetical protein